MPETEPVAFEAWNDWSVPKLIHTALRDTAFASQMCDKLRDNLPATTWHYILHNVIMLNTYSALHAHTKKLLIAHVFGVAMHNTTKENCLFTPAFKLDLNNHTITFDEKIQLKFGTSHEFIDDWLISLPPGFTFYSNYNTLTIEEELVYLYIIERLPPGSILILPNLTNPSLIEKIFKKLPRNIEVLIQSLSQIISVIAGCEILQCIPAHHGCTIHLIRNEETLKQSDEMARKVKLHLCLEGNVFLNENKGSSQKSSPDLHHPPQAPPFAIELGRLLPRPPISFSTSNSVAPKLTFHSTNQPCSRREEAAHTLLSLTGNMVQPHSVSHSAPLPSSRPILPAKQHTSIPFKKNQPLRPTQSTALLFSDPKQGMISSAVVFDRQHAKKMLLENKRLRINFAIMLQCREEREKSKTEPKATLPLSSEGPNRPSYSYHHLFAPPSS